MGIALILADDFTGANATGILLRKYGFRALTIQDINKIYEYENEYDAVCLNLDCRADDEKTAYGKIYEVAEREYGKHKIISIRIDSTLRGNIGAEIDAILDAFGAEYKALIVPSFPASNRISVGGYLIVDNKPLELTDAVKEIRVKKKSSKIKNIISRGCKREIAVIELDEVFKGIEYVKEKILKINEQIILFDAVSEENIKVITNAAFSLKQKFIPVDPGPFTAEVVKLMLNDTKNSNYNSENAKKILLLIGSITELTKGQIKYAEEKGIIDVYYVDPKRLLDGNTNDLYKEISQIIGKANKHICITTSFGNIKDYRDKLNNTDLKKIANGLALIGKEIIDYYNINLVYTSGGDVTQEFFKILKADAFDLLKEVMPLTVYGKVRGGNYDGLNLVTKGGLIGDEKAIEKIISFLES